MVALSAFALLSVLLGPSNTAMAGKPFCGDGLVKGGEMCDGADLDGQSCVSLGYDAGTLACDLGCGFDTSGCLSLAFSCGDGLVTGFEECEPSDDGACPGACSDHCACPSVSPGALELHVLDVGQGDAILVVSPDGFVTLVDAGESGQQSAVSAAMAELGLTEIDYTVVSHFHADHVGAMDLVLADHPEVVACFDHGGSYTTTQYGEYDAAAGSRRVALSAGASIDMGPSMSAQVLSADTGASLENDRSVVLRLDYGPTSILLGGDCEAGCEAGFDPGVVDIYKVHHHGSDTASSESFLALAAPAEAVISVGASNAYGHPGEAALARLDAVGATVWRTDLDGRVSVIADGTGYTINDQAECGEGEIRSCGTTDVGACSLGVETCSGAAWGACVGAIEPIGEQCDNGLDDDCDGLVDIADPDCGAAPSSLRIVQVAYDTPGDDLLEEFVDLYNPTASPVSLDGWSLADGAAAWSFPAGLTLAPGDYLSVAKDAAGFRALYGLEPDVEGMSISLNNTGDELALLEAGVEVDYLAWESYAVGWTLTAPIGDALERVDHDLDTDSAADWRVSSPAQPWGGEISACGNGVCDPGEDCTSCESDCPGRTGGKPSSRYCCGNGSCEPAGEDAASCPVDCG
jgi:beta-lactamase superfamily II metal-dependent hydrolase